MRTLVRIAFALVVGFLVAAHAQAQEQPLRIGVLLAYTGPFARASQEVTNGIELYLNEVNGKAGGRAIQLVKEDTTTKPDLALTKARKLVEADRVDAIIGPVLSSEALAIRGLLQQRTTPLIIPVAGSRDLTAPAAASEWILRICETSDQANYPMGSWVMRKTSYRKIVIVASDFVGARHQVEAFMAGYKAAGGEIVKEVYPPAVTTDYAPYITAISALQADAIFAFLAGSDAVRFVRSYRESSLPSKMALLGPNALLDELDAMGDAALGIISSGSYSAVLDTAESRDFVRGYEARYKTMPSRHSENGYVAAQLIVAAVNARKGDISDRRKFREALVAAAGRIKPPRGLIKFDKYQQAVMNEYVMKVEKRGGRLVNAIIDKFPDVSQEQTWGWWNK